MALVLPAVMKLRAALSAFSPLLLLLLLLLPSLL
jgi:hypothetical protein